MYKALFEHWIYDPSDQVYLNTPPNSSSSCLYKSLPPFTDPGLGPSLCPPPYQGSELLRAANPLKEDRELRTLRSAVPLAVVVFVAVVCVGPSDLGLCLTGALHYKSGLPTYNLLQQTRPRIFGVQET